MIMARATDKQVRLITDLELIPEKGKIRPPIQDPLYRLVYDRPATAESRLGATERICFLKRQQRSVGEDSPLWEHVYNALDTLSEQMKAIAADPKAFAVYTADMQTELENARADDDQAHVDELTQRIENTRTELTQGAQELRRRGPQHVSIELDRTWPDIIDPMNWDLFAAAVEALKVARGESQGDAQRQGHWERLFTALESFDDLANDVDEAPLILLAASSMRDSLRALDPHTLDTDKEDPYQLLGRARRAADELVTMLSLLLATDEG
ncbi:hypothetical protein VR010_12930 [Actinomycetaceae bacterium L2_0104]